MLNLLTNKKYFMQSVNKKSIALVLLLMVYAATQFSFTSGFGGDRFEVYLNNKLILQQYVSVTKGVKTFILNESNSNDEVNIYYSHCGQTGKNRVVALKDSRNKTIKEWRFADATGSNTGMTCKAREILKFLKNAGTEQVKLFYSSNYLPDGKLLAYISGGSNNKTTP
jgi:hypothetical protein